MNILEDRRPAEQSAQVFARPLVMELRRRLEVAFRPDTAVFSMQGRVPSAGHCVVVAIIVQSILGGDLASAIVGGTSHWFNRIRFGAEIFDVDLTADQFGEIPTLIADVNRLYPGTVYSGDVNRLFRRDVNKSERSDAGISMMLENIHISQQRCGWMLFCEGCMMISSSVVAA